MPLSLPTVRLTPHAQQWLTAYASARPDWDGVEPARPPGTATPHGSAGAAAVADVRAPGADDDGAGVPSRSPVVPDPVMWQAIREVRQVSVRTPLRTRTDIVAAVADSTGIAPTRVAAAIAYWADHPDEVTARLHS